jgi:hypothetical protein
MKNIPSPLAGNNGTTHPDGGIDILIGVELKSFEANPVNIFPFGSSVLSWIVEGPWGFHVEMNHEYVPKVGSKVVFPTATGLYQLTAHTKDASKVLGEILVTVNSTGCESYSAMLNPKQEIEGLIEILIEDEPRLYFQSYLDDSWHSHKILPKVTFKPGNISISIRVYIRSNKWYIPDPAVKVDLNFGLAVSQENLS